MADVREKHIVVYHSERGDLYQKVLRFTLLDEDRRRFAAERWCFLGSIDGWIHLSGDGELATLVERYAPHIGKEVSVQWHHTPWAWHRPAGCPQQRPRPAPAVSARNNQSCAT